MKPFNSFLATSLSLLLFQHPTINAIEVSRDVVIKNQTFLNDLVSEPITIDQANSLQLFDGPDITLRGDATVNGNLCIGSYTSTDLAVLVSANTLTNNGNFYVMNSESSAVDSYTWNNVYNYGNMILGSNPSGTSALQPKMKNTFVNEGHVLMVAGGLVGLNSPSTGIVNDGTIELEGQYISLSVPISGTGCLVSSSFVTIDYSKNVAQTVLLTGGQSVGLVGLDTGNIPILRVPSGASSPSILMQHSPTSAITYNTTTGILSYPPYQLDIGLGYPTTGWALSDTRCLSSSGNKLASMLYVP